MSGPQELAGEINSKDDLISFISDGCKPKSDWRIGTEHEKFGFNKETLKPLPYDGPCSIKAMLEGLQRFGWKAEYEGGNIIALTNNTGASVSLEPGGQFELSGAPLETLHQTCGEVATHIRQVKDVADKIGAGFLGVGSQPLWTVDDTPMMPKGRYNIMRRYMPTVGSHGLDMMFTTCTVQVNLDFASEADMVKKLRVSLALQPLAAALFATSPFSKGKPNGFKSWRSEIWRDTDPQRSGMLPQAFEDGFGFEAYVDYALDVPMYFVYRKGDYIDCAGQSFRTFLEGKLPALPGEKPNMSDWANHMTTIFPEARVKQFIEMRGADGGPWARLCALPAFWVGLLYDQSALDAAWDLVKDWTDEDRQSLRDQVPKLALDADLNGTSLQKIAGPVLEISEAGLRARNAMNSSGDNEVMFLNVLHEMVASGQTLSDLMLDKYAGEWKGDVSRIYEDYAY